MHQRHLEKRLARFGRDAVEPHFELQDRDRGRVVALGLGDSLSVKTGTAGGVAADSASGPSNTPAMHPILTARGASRPTRVTIVASSRSWCMALNTPLSRLSTDHAHFGAAHPAGKRQRYFLQFGAARTGIE